IGRITPPPTPANTCSPCSSTAPGWWTCRKKPRASLPMCKQRAIGNPTRLMRLKSNDPALNQVLGSNLTSIDQYIKIAMTSNHNPHEFSRRNFLKTTACLTLGSLGAGHSLPATLIKKGGIPLVAPPDVAPPRAVPPT